MGWCPRKPKKQFFEQRISHAVVNIADEEGEIDFLVGSGMRPCDFCAPRTFAKDWWPCIFLYPTTRSFFAGIQAFLGAFEKSLWSFLGAADILVEEESCHANWAVDLVKRVLEVHGQEASLTVFVVAS